MSVDASRLSAALRAQATVLVALADALGDQESGAASIPGSDVSANSEPQPTRRGRGRPAKGEAAAPAVPAANTAVGASLTAGAAPSAATGAPAGAASTSPSEADPFAPAATQAPTATLEDVRAALVALKEATSQDAALNVLKTVGSATSLPQLAAGKYDAVVAACKAALPAPKPEGDPFEVSPAQTEAPSLEDVKAAVVEAQKRTSTDAVQKVVMDHGGKAPGPNGVPGPSLKALPVPSYAAVIAAVKALPTTK